MSRRLFVALLPRWLESPGDSRPGTAVVIDTLRFTTTACQALQAGASGLLVAPSVAEARQWAQQQQPPPLLCGERHCHPIEGFDLGNSPAEYLPHRVQHREVLFTTTNGTLAVAAAQTAPRIVLAALVNRRAVCSQLRREQEGDVTIVCAGTDGEVAVEDVLAAGAILQDLQDGGGNGGGQASFCCGNDAALLALSAWNELVPANLPPAQVPRRIEQRLQQTSGGRNLLESGYADDIRFAAQLDRLDIVPQATGQAAGLPRFQR